MSLGGQNKRVHSENAPSSSPGFQRPLGATAKLYRRKKIYCAGAGAAAGCCIALNSLICASNFSCESTIKCERIA